MSASVRLGPLWVLFLLLLTPVAGLAAEPETETESIEWAGRIDCSVSTARPDSDRVCTWTGPTNLAAFNLTARPELVGLRFRMLWTVQEVAGAEQLRLRVEPASDPINASQVQGASPQDLFISRFPRDASVGELRWQVRVVDYSSQNAARARSSQNFSVQVVLTYPLGSSGEVAAKNPQDPGPQEPLSSGSPAPAAPTSTDDSRIEGTAFASGVVLVTASLGTLIVRPALLGRSAAVLLGLFSRIDLERARRHPRRRSLLDLVEERPGIRAESARVLLGWAKGTFAYHVAVLERHGFLVAQTGPGWSSLFMAHAPRARTGPGDVPIGEAILTTVRKNPGRREVDLHRILGLRPRTVRHHVLQLARRGLLRLVPDGAAMRCFAAESPPRTGPIPGSSPG